jgi:hypothetical protein
MSVDFAIQIYYNVYVSSDLTVARLTFNLCLQELTPSCSREK